ncbi:MAG: hypothetical protein CBD11_02220 [Phycisphaera sp. TMED151]|nr:MAG: hypothetical protein CBD11_02220 [Phycisphaera sp. TMED151]
MDAFGRGPTPLIELSPFVPCGGGFVDGVWILEALSKNLRVADCVEPAEMNALVTLAGGGRPP